MGHPFADFFLPASKKRKLQKSIPVEENDFVVTNQGIKRRIEEVPSAGSISVTDVATEIFPNRDEACGLFQQPLEGKRVSSKLLCTSTQISEIGLRAKAALDAKVHGSSIYHFNNYDGTGWIDVEKPRDSTLGNENLSLKVKF